MILSSILPYSFGRGEPIIGIPQIGNQPYYSPSYPGMTISVWKPTFLIQLGSF